MSRAVDSQAGGSKAEGSKAEGEGSMSKAGKQRAPNAMEDNARGSSVQIDEDMVVKEWKAPEQKEVDPGELLLNKDAGPRETYGLKGSPSSQLRIEEQRRESAAKNRERAAKRLSKAKVKETEALKEAAQAAKAQKGDGKPSMYSQEQRTSDTPSFTPSGGLAGAAASPSDRPSIQSDRPSQQTASPGAGGPRMSMAPGGMGGRASRALIGSILAGRRPSVGEERKGPKYAPSYRMESKNPFKAWQVRKILEELMQHSCKMRRYDANSASKRAISLAGDIRTAVRALNYDRYKICVKVDVAHKWDQGVSCATRFLWDVEKDDFAFHVCENSQVYIIASVYGLYYD